MTNISLANRRGKRPKDPPYHIAMENVWRAVIPLIGSVPKMENFAPLEETIAVFKRVVAQIERNRAAHSNDEPIEPKDELYDVGKLHILNRSHVQLMRAAHGRD